MTGALVIEIPDPCLVVLVGAAGSGKSTFAARNFAAGEILSSDGFRELIAGDPGDQSATRAAFSALHRALAGRLAHGLLTVVDATSVRRAARQALLRRASAATMPAVAIVLDLPSAAVHERNLSRSGRIVPTAAVDRQLGELAAALRPGGIETEGFAAVHRLRDVTAVERGVIRRTPTSLSRTRDRAPGTRERG